MSDKYKQNIKHFEAEGPYSINGENYIPLPFINHFSSYSYSRIRGLINEGYIPENEYIKICNLHFLKQSYLPELERRKKGNIKNGKVDFMINKYYSKK